MRLRALREALFVLKINYFEFGNKIKQQISVTAIRIKYVPPYACIFMSNLENEFLDGQHLQLLVRLRYIDNTFFIWTHGEESLKKFLEEFHGFNQDIIFTYVCSVENIPFLDLKAELHVKPTDRQQYLYLSSAHPNHTKGSVVFNQILRMNRLCSSESDFERNKEKKR